MATPEEIETQRALERAVGQVRSETEADRVLTELEQNAADRTEADVAEGKRGPNKPSEPAAHVWLSDPRSVFPGTPKRSM